MTLEAKIYFTVSNEDFEKMVNSKKSVESVVDEYFNSHSLNNGMSRYERMFHFGNQLVLAVKNARKIKKNT